MMKGISCGVPQGSILAKPFAVLDIYIHTYILMIYVLSVSTPHPYYLLMILTCFAVDLMLKL